MKEKIISEWIFGTILVMIPSILVFSMFHTTLSGTEEISNITMLSLFTLTFIQSQLINYVRLIK